MSRHIPPAELEFPGADSFLDVVTNIVGILVILIVLVGARAKYTPVELPADAAKAKEVSAAQQIADGMEQDVRQLTAQIAAVEGEIMTRGRERQAVATFIAAADHELGERRSALDAAARGEYDRRRDLALVQADIDRARTERMRISSTPSKVAKIDSYPTPLAKAVDGKELHFQLKAGRLTYVPMEDLLEKLKGIAQEKVWRLKDSPEFTDTIGPIDGFYMRYTLERHDIPWDMHAPPGEQAGRSVVQLAKCEFLPTTSQLGELIEEALAPRSTFRNRLAEGKPGQWTVTLWTYPDSFTEFRRLRKELYELGYPTAGRPLQDGTPIGASSRGTKSAAE